MKKKILAVLMCAAIGMAATSCTTNTGTQTGDNSLTYIKGKGKFIVGLDIAFPPIGYRDESGNIVGFDVDMAKEAAKRMDLKVEFKPIDWKAKEMELNNKNIDVIWNGYTITPEREKSVLFTKPYIQNGQILIVKENSAIKSKADVSGKIVGYQNASSALGTLKEDQALYKSVEKTTKGFDDNGMALMDLKNGGVDVVIVDQFTAANYAKQINGGLRILPEAFGEDKIGVGLRKNDVLFQQELQKALDSMSADGTIKALSIKWLGKDISIK